MLCLCVEEELEQADPFGASEDASAPCPPGSHVTRCSESSEVMNEPLWIRPKVQPDDTVAEKSQSAIAPDPTAQARKDSHGTLLQDLQDRQLCLHLRRY